MNRVSKPTLVSVRELPSTVAFDYLGEAAQRDFARARKLELELS